MKYEKFMNISFYVITFLWLVFTFQYFFGVNEENQLSSRTLIGIVFIAFYAYTYYCHIQYQKYITKKYFVEKEEYNIILNELINNKKENN